MRDEHPPQRPDERDCRNIYERIEAARANFPAIVKGATGQVGTRTYQYADIAAVVEGVEDALRAEGVGIFPTVDGGSVITLLRVIADRETSPSNFRLCSIPLPADLTPQQTGSAITYFRRYALVLLLNLLTEDDDGAVASMPPRTREEDAPAQTEKPAPEGWDSEEQAAAAHAALRERIIALPPDFSEVATKFWSDHPKPMPVPIFNELEEIVRVAEGFGA